MSALAGGGEWSACVAVARHALQAYKNKDGTRQTWGLAVCAIALAIFAVVAGGRIYKPLMGVVCALVGMLVFGLWVAVFKSLMAQNAMPAALVPGIGRRSRKVLAFVWLVATVGLTMLLAQTGLPVVATAIAVAWVLIFAALSMIRPGAAVLMMGTLISLNSIHRHLMPVSPGQVLIVCMLMSLPAAVVVVRAMSGGKSSVIHDFTLSYFMTVGETGAPGTAYAKTLKRDSVSGNTAALLVQCLGPLVAMPPAWLAVAAVLLLALTYALTLAVPSLGAVYGAESTMFMAIPASFMSSMLMQAYAMGASLRRTAGEQALVMLVGRRPDAAVINRLLGRALMVRYGYHWVTVAVLVIGLCAIFGARAEQLAWMLALFVIALAAGTLVLQNYAKAKNDNPTVPVLLALGAAATLVVSILAKTSLLLGGAFVALWAMVAVVSFALRWKAMMRAPVALPARRLT